MHIVVNTRLLIPNKLDGIGWFTHEVLSRLTADLSEHRFTFLFDRPFDKQFIYGENVEGVALFPPTRHPLLYQYYFQHVIPRQLKKLNADLFFSPDGFLTTKTSIPQVPVIHDLNFEHRPEDLPSAYRNYYRNFFPQFARKASRIITVSSYSKADIAQTYGIDEALIDVAYNGYNQAYRPLSDAEKQAARTKYANGKPYFIFIGNFSYRKNIHGIIKAFDHYKQSGGEGKLVLVGNPLWKYPEMERALTDGEFSEDIIFAGRLEIEDLVHALGGSTALVFPSYFEGFGIPIIEAFAAQVPVITSTKTSLPEVAGEGALYADPDDHANISSHMSALYYNVNQSVNLIKSGQLQLQKFSWDNTSNKVKSSLFNTVNSTK